MPGMGLMGLGHSLIDALIDYCRSEAVSGDVLNAVNGKMQAIKLFSYKFIIRY
ncbi:MAG TPA: hypothetical protein VJ202_02250 [Thermodesulfobacteriota bacterium]|nr:hypothetical protein [Thermodesulfobacteriota bacterium]